MAAEKLPSGKAPADQKSASDTGSSDKPKSGGDPLKDLQFDPHGVSRRDRGG